MGVPGDGNVGLLASPDFFDDFAKKVVVKAWGTFRGPLGDFRPPEEYWGGVVIVTRLTLTRVRQKPGIYLAEQEVVLNIGYNQMEKYRHGAYRARTNSTFPDVQSSLHADQGAQDGSKSAYDFVRK